MKHNIRLFVRLHWKFFAGLFLVLAVGGGGTIFVQSRKNQQPEYTVISLQKKTIRKTLEVSGVVDASQRARLRFLAGGKVVYVGAHEGDTVKKWQTIASIDKKDLEKNLQKYLNTYESTRTDFDQNLNTAKDVHGDKETDRNLVKNTLTLQNAILDVELKDIAVKNASLYSPIDGILITSPAKNSGVILLSTDLFEIVNPKTLYLEVEVDEADVGFVHESQSVEIVFDAYPDETIQSIVGHIAFNNTETSSGTVYKVRLDLPDGNEQLKYRLGMNATATILLSKKEDVFAIPTTSLIEKDGKKIVELETDSGKIEGREVTIGLATEDDVEILSGISETDKVIQR